MNSELIKFSVQLLSNSSQADLLFIMTQTQKFVMFFMGVNTVNVISSENFLSDSLKCLWLKSSLVFWTRRSNAEALSHILK